MFHSKLTLYLLLCGCFFAFVTHPQRNEINDFFSFKFKGKAISLPYGMQDAFEEKNAKYSRKDTLSNVYYPYKKYVEIIRQDHPIAPHIGIAMGFEFDEENGEYPYTPEYAVIQLKDFGYGGVTFDNRDTCNYTGISNAVSEDISIEIDGYQNDTIFGRFTGLLLSGAGPMTPIEEGRFKVRLLVKTE